MSRNLAAGRIAGTGDRTAQEMYRGAIIGIINTKDRKHYAKSILSLNMCRNDEIYKRLPEIARYFLEKSKKVV